MPIDLLEEPMSRLIEHARIAIAFEVDRVLDVTEGPAGFALSERSLATPYRKDYDALAGNAPTRWATEFDVSRWGLIAARSDGRRVGGVVVAFDTPGVTMLEDRRDLAVLWDVRVAPDFRGRGVGSALLRASVVWAGARGCREMKVETQDINVAACRFYERQGFSLRVVRRSVYPACPDELQLLWYRDLAADR